MEGSTILTWNVANWITVVLMAVVGFAVIGLVANTTSKLGSKDAAN